MLSDSAKAVYGQNIIVDGGYVYKQLAITLLDVIEPNSNLLDAITALNDSKQKIIAIGGKSNNNLIYGMISDGDIRRALLNGATMQSRVMDYSNKNYQFVENELELMQAEKILNEGYKAVPIARGRIEKGKILAFVSRKGNADSKELSAMIMAGGKGKRLRPLTNNIPKPMINVNGKPMLHHQIDALKNAGVENVYISVSYLKGYIMDYFGDMETLMLTLDISKKFHSVLAGSLKKFPSDVRKLFCINADLVINLNYKNMSDFWMHSEADLLTACQQYIHQIPFGVLDIQGLLVKGIHEKPTIVRYVNTGIHILGQKAMEVCRSIEEHVFDIPHLIDKFRAVKGCVLLFMSHGWT